MMRKERDETLILLSLATLNKEMNLFEGINSLLRLLIRELELESAAFYLNFPGMAEYQTEPFAWQSLKNKPPEFNFSKIAPYKLKVEALGQNLGLLVADDLPNNKCENSGKIIMLKLVSGFLASFIVRMNVQHDLEDRNNQLSFLLSWVNGLNQLLNYQELMEYTLNSVVKQFDLQAAAILYVSTDAGYFCLNSKQKLNSNLYYDIFQQLKFDYQELQNYNQQFSRPEMDWIDYSTAQIQLSEELTYLSPELDYSFQYPLICGGRKSGFLIVYKELPRGGISLDSSLIRTLKTLALNLAVALENTRLLQVERKAAQTDGLTGLFNRRYFEKTALAELQRSQRYNLVFSLIICDLDYFKQVNDTFGHSAGDDVLKQFSETIRQNIRNIDIPCRIGGEEFAVILPETGLESALVTAERIREKTEIIKVMAENGVISISSSFGVATVGKDFWESETLNEADYLEKIMDFADKSLYYSKEEGRNRVSYFCQNSLQEFSIKTYRKG